MRFLLDLFRPSVRMVAVGVCMAGILHLCVALASPLLSDSPAYRTLAKGLTLNTFTVLPPVTPGTEKLPYMGPESRYAACLFDSKGGSVAVTASLPSPGWVLSIFTPAGDNIYSAVAQPARALDIELRLVPLDDKAAAIVPTQHEIAARDDTALTVPVERGILVIRAPDQGNAYQARNLAGLARAKCAYTARPKV